MRKKLYKLFEKISGRDVTSKMKFLEDVHYYDVKELNQYHENKLNVLLRQARRTPFYYKLLKDKSNSNIEDLFYSLPIMSKENLMQEPDLFINDEIPFEYHSSGGSSGKPIKVRRSDLSLDYASAENKNMDSWANIDINSKKYQFWGASKDLQQSIKNDILGRLLNTKYFNSYVWRESDKLKIYDQMQIDKPDAIISYASALSSFVDTMLDHELIDGYKPSNIIVSADMLTENNRKKIEEYFDTTIFNRYGCRELGIIASDCGEGKGMHISSGRLLVEIIDDAGKPVKDNQVGDIVITDLFNYSMPLIRYKIGDRGSIDKKKCSCGRTSPRITKIQGRDTEYIKMTSGDKVRIPAYFISQLKGVKQLQIVQKRYKELTIIISANRYLSSSEEIYISEKINSYTSDKMKCYFEYNNLISDPSGKYRFIINEMI